MKALIMSVTVLAMFCWCGEMQAEQAKTAKAITVLNDLAVLGLKGKVKNLNESTCDAVIKDGEIQKGNVREKKVTLFNAKGNITEISKFGKDEKLESKTVVKYDGSDRKTEEVESKSDGSLISKTTFKYDNSGSLIERLKSAVNEYDKNKTMEFKDTFKYDDNGNMVEHGWYSVGNLTMKTICKYDTQGNMIDVTLAKPDGSLSNHDVFNAKGYMIESNEYKTDGKLSLKYTYKHDDNVLKPRKLTFWREEENTKGNPLETCAYNPDGSLKEKKVSKNTYDAKGNLTEANNYKSDGSVESRGTYKYDAQGNKIEFCVYNADGTRGDKYTWKYDNAGNWIVKAYTFSNNEFKRYMEREIKYY